MSLENPSAQERKEKEDRLEDIRQRVERTTDKLGEPVDLGIRESIVFFKALDINTTGSCEGHENRGRGGPYIDIESKEAVEMVKRARETPELKNDKVKYREVLKQISQKNFEERKKLINYLDEFYKGRITSYDARLVIQGGGRGQSGLENQGADLQKIRNEEERKKKLEEYQKEMQEFTEFLKNKYFEE